MIQSMTGYGVGKAANANYHITLEIKSLNSRNAEVFLRLPHYYFQQEVKLKNHLSAKLERGKMSVVLSVEVLNPELSQARVKIDYDLIAAYHRDLNKVQEQLQLNEGVSMSTLLTLPGVVSEQAAEVSEEEWKLVLEALEKATEDIILERKKEGAALAEDLTNRLNKLRLLVEQVPAYSEGRVDAVRTRITAAFADLGEDLNSSEERLQQELVYYLEKYDINEELVRIHAHLENLEKTMAEEHAQGRKLTFVVQELWREVNTLGVKSYDLNIQNIVVQMKDELEKMKEQLMNIL